MKENEDSLRGNNSSEQRESIERTPTRLESRRASTNRESSEQRALIRQKQAKRLVEAELRIEPNIDLIVEKISREVDELRKQIDALTKHDASLQENLEFAKEKLAHAMAQQKEQEGKPVDVTEHLQEIEYPLPEKTPGLLARLNRWLRSEGRPERDSLSYSTYDRTQHPQAKAARDDARQASMKNIADAALRGHRDQLLLDQAALVEAQEKVKNASFLTKWIHEGHVQQLQKDIRFREAAMRAGNAKLEKQKPLQDKSKAA
jgi:hypothetical protein